MNDPRKFKAPFIPKERIWQEADRLRGAHPAGRKLPVEVLDLAEFDLGLDLVPVDGLREELDIDALLMGDLKSTLVDKRAFMNPRLEYRLRFSVAHEIGHLILHRDIYGGCNTLQLGITGQEMIRLHSRCLVSRVMFSQSYTACKIVLTLLNWA